jgi:hypothetical protein
LAISTALEEDGRSDYFGSTQQASFLQRLKGQVYPWAQNKPGIGSVQDAPWNFRREHNRLDSVLFAPMNANTSPAAHSAGCGPKSCSRTVMN